MHRARMFGTECVRGGGRRAAILVVALLAVLPGLSPGQEAPAAGGEPGPSSPRSAARGYLEACRAGDYERAAQSLDLRRLPASARRAEGPALARKLKAVMDRELWVEVDELSDEPAGKPDDGLPADRDLIGTITTAKGPAAIALERVPGGNGAPVWKISAATVARIPDLYAEFGPGWPAELLPAPFFELQVLEVRLWQWVGLLLLVAVVGALSWALAAALAWMAGKLVARTAMRLDDAAVAAAGGPVRLALAAMLLSPGIYALGLAVPVQRAVGGVLQALFIVAAAWLFVRLVDLAARVFQTRLIERGQVSATTIVPLGRRTIQLFIAAVAVLAILQNIGFNITSILAGLGIGGLAVALAAQKTLENLFGGLTLIFDRPVRVGDFCRFGDRMGTVEDIGLRSSRVRTLDRTVVTVPNAEFAGMQIENFGLRDRVWLHPTIGLRYETTPDQLRWVLVNIKRMLLQHPKVDPSPARVRFVGFGAFSLDLEVFAYVLTADINEFLAVQEDIFLRLVDIVNESGTGFAFPSQTIYTGTDGGLDAEKSRAAEAQVEQWRRENALCLPDVPAAEAARLRGTLEYPARGTAART